MNMELTDHGHIGNVGNLGNVSNLGHLANGGWGHMSIVNQSRYM